MQVFRVWAPRAQQVDVVVADRQHPMERAPGGWWELSVPEASSGCDYAFSLEGGTPLPDPRSAFQPHGIHGPSRLVDHSTFPWSDGAWRGVPVAGSIIYECHIGTFSAPGTFDGAIEHLDYLADLGVDAIELLPVAEFSGRRGWGYDGVDLFAPHHSYGGPSGLKRLVDAAHARSLGVVMDVVYNHLGPAGNYLAQFGPYFSGRHQTNWGDAVNFDGPGSDEVRRFVIDNALMWLRDYHCDGLRIDAAHAIVDDSATHVLEEMAVETRALASHARREMFLIAESDLNDPRFVRGRDTGGYSLDAAWADEWHHALHATLTGDRTGYYEDFGSVALLAKALRQAWVYDGIYSPHRRRVHGRPPAGLVGTQFVVCTQNHDQIGNRALGERTAALMSQGRLRVAAALLLVSPFVPLLFQGEEWGASTPFQYFTDHEDPDLGRAITTGRRDEFATFDWDTSQVPDPQDPATFDRSRIDWHERTMSPHAELLAWYRHLIALRRQLPALTDPRLESSEVQFDEEEDWLHIRRGSVVIAVNLGTQDRADPTAATCMLLAASHPSVRLTESGLILPPDSVAVLDVLPRS